MAVVSVSRVLVTSWLCGLCVAIVLSALDVSNFTCAPVDLPARKLLYIQRLCKTFVCQCVIITLILHQNTRKLRSG